MSPKEENIRYKLNNSRHEQERYSSELTEAVAVALSEAGFEISSVIYSNLPEHLKRFYSEVK